MEQTPPRRTLLLTERVATECRLTAEDVHFLLAGHRAHVELLPTRHRGRYSLTPTGHVGTIVGPNVRLVIRPKIPLSNLFHLLDPAGPLPVVDDATAATPGTEALDFLAGRLAHLLRERAAAGLHRAYAERAEQGPFLHGRLDVAAQLRDPNGRRDRLHCRYEEFGVDIPCNQVPRATADLVLRSPLADDGVRAALRRSLQDFAGVSSVPLGPDSFQAAEPDRLTEAYRPLLDLCRLLADSLAPQENAGPVACPAFLLDMERVFERYVTAGVQAAFAGKPGYAVAVQPLHRANRPVPDQPDIPMRPDVTIERGERWRCVVDAKWKRLGRSLVSADVYQVLAYATALGARRAVLVYPGRRERTWTYRFHGMAPSLLVHTLRVVGPRERCRRSLGRLGRMLRARGPSAG
jgi:5-methylcytosine-specific restriction endonuclease McrBC regulatory subunit McrC